jgi:hypothetical protein
MYGGFWLNIPRNERLAITLNGEPTVELDYATLHPAMLYARVGKPLIGDPYKVPGYGHIDREMGKRTFARLLNGRKVSLAHDPEDKKFIPNRNEFRPYVEAIRHNLRGISAYLGVEYGLRLQKADADLAISVIQACVNSDIAVLPVHDSFIVSRGHESELRAIMEGAAVDHIGVQLRIRSKRLPF